MTASTPPAKPIDRRHSLAGVPMLNPSVTVDRTTDGSWVLVATTRHDGKGLMARFLPPVQVRRVELDELGTFVVGQIDGVRDVLEIVNAFATRFKVNRREAELSVVEFLKSLVQRHLVSIAIK